MSTKTKCTLTDDDRLHSRECTNWCDEGYIDESEDDPINFMPGESLRKCPECRGTGIEWWCPSCGENLSGVELKFQNEY